MNAQGIPQAGALVTFFPLNAPLVDSTNAANLITSAVVKTRTATDGSFSQSLKRAIYRIEFAELDRMKLDVVVESGTVNIGTIVLP